jgi:hypothetical protein
MLKRTLICAVLLFSGAACGVDYDLSTEPLEPSSLQGKWSGDWRVKALGKGGDASLTFRVAENSQMEVLVELNGSPFNTDPPYAQFLRGPMGENSVTLRGALNKMGNVKLTIGEFGKIEGEANPSAGRIDFEGGIANNHLDMGFKIFLVPGDVDLDLQVETD